MPIGKGHYHVMKWGRAMQIAKKEYPNLGKQRLNRVAAAIMGIKRKK